MAWSRPDAVKSCATIAPSPNQPGTEGTTSEVIWSWTDGYVIRHLFSLVGESLFFFLLRRHIVLCFTMVFPLLSAKHSSPFACYIYLVAHLVGIRISLSK